MERPERQRDTGSAEPAPCGRRGSAGQLSALPPVGAAAFGPRGVEGSPSRPPAPLWGLCGAGSAVGGSGEGAREEGSSHAVPACAAGCKGSILPQEHRWDAGGSGRVAAVGERR